MNPDALFESATGGAVAIAAGLANLVALLVLIRALAPRDLLAERARLYARRRNELRTALLSRKRRKLRPTALARRVVTAMKLNSDGQDRQATGLLVQAGWRSPDALPVFLAARLTSPAVTGLATYYAAAVAAPTLSLSARALIAGVGLLFGAYLPTLAMRNIVQKRHLRIRNGLSDALDLFVICAEAGLSLDAAMTRVSRELATGYPDLADELALTVIELGFLPNRRDALGNLVKRASIPEIRALINTLSQTEKYGTPLAQSLRTLAAEFRATRMARAEEKAARLPAILTIPMITFILPPLFIVLIGPAIVSVLSVINK